MKHARKLASLLLALVMVFALATTAFASETVTPPTTGTITVANPVANQEYKAYKIFDVVYDAAKEHYSYTIDSTSEWFNTVSAYATGAHGLTLTQVNGGDTYVVTTGNGFSAPDFAVALKAAVDGMTGLQLSGDANSVSVSNLDLGYYFVASSTGALCNLTTTNPTVTIHDKNDMPFEKTDNKVSADVGETVNYTITGKVPDTMGFETYTYEIADTMSEGLTFNRNSLAVKVGSADVTADTDKCTIAYDAETAPNTFKVTILVKNCTVGDAITVTYTATVNEKAIAVVSKNEAKLTYSNDPTDSTHTTTTPAQKQEVYSSKIVIDKFESGSKTTKLPNAKFVLYKEVTTDAGTSLVYYKWNTDKKVEWVADKNAATVMTTNAQGEATFGGAYSAINAVERGGAAYEKALRCYGNLDGYKEISDGVSAEISKFKLSTDLNVKRVVGDVGYITGGGSSVDDMVASIGKLYTEKGFTSTTIAQDAQLPFGGHKDTQTVLDIIVPKSTRGAYIYKMADNPAEFEFLIDRGTTYKVLDAGERTVKKSIFDLKSREFVEKEVPERYMKLEVVSQ